MPKSPLLILAVLALWWSPARAQKPQAPNQAHEAAPTQDAAQKFARGQELYNQGNYPEAIKAFSAAHQLAPHPSNLFNIARCHENLGQVAAAMDFYQRALHKTTDPTGRKDIARRLDRLRSLPVKVFVSSDPPNAQISVDGAPTEDQHTPALLQLKPGGHVVLLQAKGFLPTVRRIEVQPGRELTLEFPLQVAPRIKDCPPPPPAPKANVPAMDLGPLHLHFSVAGEFGLTSGRKLTSGPGFYSYFTYRNLFFGGRFSYFRTGEESSTEFTNPDGDRIEGIAKQRWVLAQVEGGYVFSFRNFYLYSTLALGTSADRLVHEDPAGTGSYTQESYSFAGSLGGGIDALATSWLSLGGSVRGGLTAGKRPDRTQAEEETNDVFPYLTFGGHVTFHL